VGIVPRGHVLVFMRQALRVINPRLFEGFGLSVANANRWQRSAGPDLPRCANRRPPTAHILIRTDPAALADHLEMLWQTIPAGPDLALESAARAALPAAVGPSPKVL